MPAALTCNGCQLVHPPLVTCNVAQAETMTKLLQQIGLPDTCRCQQPIVWVRHLDGSEVAYDYHGLSHSPCPEHKRCPECHLIHMPQVACYQAQAAAMLRLLGKVGDVGACRCRVQLYWVVHRNGKRAPYTSAGLNHFIDCTRADEFRRTRGKDAHDGK